MSGTPRSALLGRLSPLARAASASAAVAGIIVVLAVVPGGDSQPQASGIFPAEREVVTLDVDPTDGPGMLNARLASVRSALARTGLASRVATRSTAPRSAAAGRVVTAPASHLPLLRLGDSGRAVAFLQRRLGVKPTGLFGPITYAAVVALQRRQGLPAQGIVGPATWRALINPRDRQLASTGNASRTASVPAVSAPVTDGRICPAPGATFGDGWLVPRSGHLHQGQDLMGHKGMPILAIEDGVVIREGRQSNGALTIVLQGVSGSKFFYGHMSRDLVHAGTRVRRGQVMGLMGDSGSPGAVHLHFEFWKSGGESAAVDPAPLLHSLCG